LSGSAHLTSCLIVGASGGIGRALAKRLDADGVHLTLVGRTEGALRDVAASLENPAVCIEADASDFSAMDEICGGAAELHAAVNLAGSILLKPASMTSRAEYDETICQNLTTAFSLVRGASKAMRKTGGSIVLMSSCAGSYGLMNHECIAAAKGAIEGLVRAAAASGAPSGIRVNGVAPGLVDTPLARPITSNERALRASVRMHPLGRIGEPDEVSRVIEFLLAPQSSWITGQVLGVDGGLARVQSRSSA
jgi:NAD(P)-dependent dehydrogenase (short-subunit alcohol dehydrogenase family)